MRSAALFAMAGMAVSPAALAETTTLSTNSSWLTLGADDGTVKGCAVQTGVNGGKFTIGGATDRQGILTVSLSKSTWTIPNLPVPIVLTFANGEIVRLSGKGTDTRISTDVPEDTVKPLIHYFTAESSAVLTLPEGREAPWHLDLHGTTPATLAMVQCIDAAQLVLPAPFRKPIPPVQPPSPDHLVSATPPPDATQPQSSVNEPAASTPPESAVAPSVPSAKQDASVGDWGPSGQSLAAAVAAKHPPAYVAPQQSDNTGQDQSSSAPRNVSTTLTQVFA